MNSHGIKRLEVMNQMEGAILLLDTEKVRSVGGIQGFVDTSCKLVFEYLDDVV